MKTAHLLLPLLGASMAGTAAPDLLVAMHGGGFQNGIVDRYPDGAEFFAWDGKTAGYEGHLVYSWTWMQALFARQGLYGKRVLEPLR